MAVTFQLPAELEKSLRDGVSDVEAQAKEAFLVSLYRQGKLTHVGLAQALGLDRFETEQVLHKHNVTEDLPTADEVLAEVRDLEQLRNAGC
jgi:hypothetical protein